MKTIHARIMGCVLALLLVAGGCGGGGSDPLAPVTVNGTVLFQRTWGDVSHPAVGFTVEVVGHPMVTTDGSGRFTVANVARPYTVILIDNAQPGAYVYVGLTLPDPVLQGPRPPSPVQYDGQVSGTVTGGSGFPTPASHVTRVALGQTERRGMGTFPASAADGSFGPTTVVWGTGTSLTITAAALQWERDVADVPIAFHGFGTALVGVADGATTNVADLPMAGVSDATVSGTISTPAGYGVTSSAVEIELDDGPFFEVSMGTQPAGSFSTAAPVLSAATIQLRFRVYGPAGESVQLWRTVQPGTTGLALQSPEGVMQTDPPDGVTIDPYAVSFRADGPSGAAYRAWYSPDFPAPGPYLVLTMPDAEWMLPDLSAYGVNLAANTTYVWEVEALGPASVDDLCSGSPFTSWSSRYWSLTDEFYFTTLP